MKTKLNPPKPAAETPKDDDSKVSSPLPAPVLEPKPSPRVPLYFALCPEGQGPQTVRDAEMTVERFERLARGEKEWAELLEVGDDPVAFYALPAARARETGLWIYSSLDAALAASTARHDAGVDVATTILAGRRRQAEYEAGVAQQRTENAGRSVEDRIRQQLLVQLRAAREKEKQSFAEGERLKRANDIFEARIPDEVKARAASPSSIAQKEMKALIEKRDREKQIGASPERELANLTRRYGG